MTRVRLEPAAPRSRVKHSTTEPLRSLTICGTIHCKRNDYKPIYSLFSFTDSREPSLKGESNPNNKYVLSERAL